MKNNVIWGIVLVLVVVLAGWYLGSSRPVSNESIKIGAILSETGVASAFGEMARMGAELAVEEINSSGGIEGRQVVLVIEDDGTNGNDAISAFRKLVDVDRVDAIFGGLFSFVAQPIFPVALDLKTAYISPINFTIEDSFVTNEVSFVLYPELELVVEELKNVIEVENVERLAVVHFPGDLGEEIAETLIEIQAMRGKPTVLVEQYAEIGGTDFRTIILKLKSKGIDTVFLDTLDFDTVKFAQQAQDLSFKPRIFSHTTLRDVLSREDVDHALLEGAIMLDWEVTSEEFARRFKDRYGVVPRRGADKSYEAVYVLAEAIANSGSVFQIPKYIEEHSFSTINGVLKFTEKHATESTDVGVFRIQNGEFVRVGE